MYWLNLTRFPNHLDLFQTQSFSVSGGRSELFAVVGCLGRFGSLFGFHFVEYGLFGVVDV